MKFSMVRMLKPKAEAKSPRFRYDKLHGLGDKLP